jgi:thiol-disulfide isomerase/thioredoxin
MKKFAIPLIVLILIVGGIYWLQSIPEKPGVYDEFASCLKEQGAIFYGAFWCPHCQNQKKLFGRSADKLPYIECSTPDGRGQLQICIDKQITTYPTWDFVDGEKMTGEIPLKTLSDKTSCPLPQE